MRADVDGDGFAASEDCDDRNVRVSPAAGEVCDGLDNDCDGLIDDEDDSVDLANQSSWYPDHDFDGYGDHPG